jgi:hypothetical protein
MGATKKKITTFKLVAFDSEDDSQGNVSIFDFYDGEEHYTYARAHYKTDDDYFTEIIKFIYGYSPNKKCIFFAHNLEYDINNLMRHFNWCYIDDMLYTARLISCSLKECQHDFWDSFNFFPASLAKIATIVGMKKGDYLEARQSLAQDIEYCQDDTEILWNFVDQFQDQINTDFQTKIYPTVGKMSMEVFRNRFLLGDMDACSTQMCLDSYYGGRVEVYTKGLIDGEVDASDINSAYPHVMQFEYPDTSTLVKSKLATHEYGVGKFTIFVPDSCYVPPLPHKDKDGRLWFPKGELTGTWTYAEVRNAVEYGCTIIKETEGVGTNVGRYFFKDYISHFYGKRLDAKADKNEFLDLFYKLFMNNLYGKFCQHTDRITFTTSAKDELEEFLDKTLGPFFIYKEPCIEPPDTSNYLWGTYVTSYARIYLHNSLADLDRLGHQLVYCDTDSIFYRKKKGAEVPFDISKKLGDWDEEKFTHGHFYNPKGYILYKFPEYFETIRWKTAEVYWGGDLQTPTTTHEAENYVEGYDTKNEKWVRGIYSGMKDGKHGIQFLKLASKGVPTKYGYEFLTTGVAEFKKPVKMRESFIQNLTANYWEDTSKKMLTVYVKRKFDSKTNRTWPVDVKDIPKQIENMKRMGQKLSKEHDEKHGENKTVKKSYKKEKECVN